MIEGTTDSCRSYLFSLLAPHLTPNDRIQICWNALIRGPMLGRTLRVLMRCDSPPPQIGSAWHKLALRHLLNVTVTSVWEPSCATAMYCPIQTSEARVNIVRVHTCPRITSDRPVPSAFANINSPTRDKRKVYTNYSHEIHRGYRIEFNSRLPASSACMAESPAATR